MKPLRRALALATSLTLVGAVAASASGTLTWSAARQAVLPAGATGLPNGYLPTLSCASAGNCEAGGAYNDANGNIDGLILNEVNGTWTAPTILVAPAGAATKSDVTIYGLSCGSVGNCSAVGSYLDSAANTQAFVANEVNQKWSPATEVNLPTNALRTGQSALVRSVACSSAGNCSAVGSYLDSASPIPRNVSFVLSEVGGTWQNASEIFLTSSANFNPNLAVSQVACSSAGNCSAVGSFIDVNDVTQALVVNQVYGAWSRGQLLTLPANASAWAGASLSEVTCVQRASCTAWGTYNTNTGAVEGLLASESNGQWPRAKELAMPSDAASNPHVFLYGFQGIACASVGNCSLGGQYLNAAGKYEGFLANEDNGTWKSAVTLGLPSGAQYAGKNGGVVAITCPQVGNCRAGAAYVDSTGLYQALVVTETNGVWQRGTTVTLPGAALSVGVDGGVYSIVCATTTACTAAGSYLASGTVYQGFTLSS